MTGWINERLEVYRPRNLTGGAPFFPLFVLFGLNAVDELDRHAFNVLLPEIRDEFGLDIQGALTLVAVAGLAVVLLQIPISYFADRANRVRIATVGAAGWACFSVFTGLAPTIALLAVARVGSAVGKGVNDPTHNSLIADYYGVGVRANVYGFHRAANAIGQFLGPALGGLLAAWFTWRTPFIVFAVPTAVFVVLALRMKEPVRGAQERMAMHASEDVVATAEIPPSYAEAWRILWQVRTLRRLWYSFPFLAAAVLGFQSLLSIYYDEVFGLGEAQRGFIAAFAEPAQLLGLAIGIPVATRLLRRDPSYAVKFLSYVAFVLAGSWLLFVLAPALGIAVAANVLVSGVVAVVVPGLFASLSLTIPPRVRAMGFTVGSIFLAPGLLILVFIGALADRVGVRLGMAVLAPVLVAGGVIIRSAAAFMAGDIARVRTSALAQSEVLAARRRGEFNLLRVRDLDVSYSGTQVLFGVDFDVDEGEIVALLGTNGAGKSTLLKAISGIVEANAGAVIFDGRDITHAPPHEIVASGAIQVPGGRGVFADLTVAENLRIAGWLFRRDTAYVKAATERAVEHFPVLRERWEQPAGNLSGGEQQMLTLAQAFIAKPKLLMIDELSLGLAPVIVQQLLDIVRAIRDQGTTVIIVEQSVNIALTLAETAYFMEKGEIRFKGPTSDLLNRPDVLRSVFLEGAASVQDGSRASMAAVPAIGTRRTQASVRRNGEPALEVHNLAKKFGGVMAVGDVSLALHNGEILGVIGPNGAGKTTLFDLVSGFIAPDAGAVLLNGGDVTHASPDVRSLLGLGRSFQDARLFPALTVAETIAVYLDRHVEVRDPLAAALNLPAVGDSEQLVSRRVDDLIEMMNLGAFRDKFISELSTGSRRIVDLACVLAHDPTVLLFDEPSSGIAQRETEALGPLLLRIRETTGASLLVIEHDMPLITSIADRMVALDLGKVVTHGAPSDVVNHPHVVASYLGSTEAVIARSGTLAGRARRRRANPLRATGRTGGVTNASSISRRDA